MATTKQRKLFDLGQIAATPCALGTTKYGFIELMPYVSRHAAGDWGCIDPEDWAMNDAAVSRGGRIMSAYAIDPEKPCAGHGDNCIWVITEADRSVTTLLLPFEY